jgi:hypothetical protein
MDFPVSHLMNPLDLAITFPQNHAKQCKSGGHTYIVYQHNTVNFVVAGGKVLSHLD